MIRLLAILVALLFGAIPHPTAPAPPSGHATSTGDWIALDATMPASSSWIAIPITARGDITLDARTTDPRSRAEETHDASMFFIVRDDDADLPGFSAGTGVAPDLVAMNFDQRRIACCQLPAVAPVTPPPRGGSGIEGMRLGDGKRAWVTYIVANADPDSPPIELRAHDGTFDVGARREGTDVRIVDLVEEAYAAGTNLRLQGRLLVGAPAAATLDLTPTMKGLLFMFYGARGAERLTLSVDVGGVPLLERQEMRDVDGVVVALGAAAYTLKIDGVDDGTATARLAGGTPSRLAAVGLYADLDVPGGDARAYQWPAQS